MAKPALTSCPDCGKQVSRSAVSCPGCGRPIAMRAGPFGGQEKGITTRPGFWHDPNVGAVGLFILSLVVVLVVYLMIWLRVRF